MKFIQLAVEEIIGDYKGASPLAHYLKQFFKARPKLGSRDRRAISDAVYTFYRIARFVPQAERTIWNIIHWALDNGITSNPQLQKICAVLPTENIVPDFKYEMPEEALSDGITTEHWLKGLLHLPKTFIRLRVAAFNVAPILKAKGLSYEQITENTLAFPNGYNLADALPEQFYVVQDYASQRSLDAFAAIAHFQPEDKFNIWDSCSGAGGKMLLIKDKFPKAHILCTDIRGSILHNLKERAKLYYHKNVQTQILDSSDAKTVGQLKEDFDCVISTPCSGSGTWARTPEQFYFFGTPAIQKFNKLQSAIAQNAASKVKTGGYFIYITCSVFRAENEEVVSAVLQHHPQLSLKHQSLINGIADGADSMFVAVMQADNTRI